MRKIQLYAFLLMFVGSGLIGCGGNSIKTEKKETKNIDSLLSMYPDSIAILLKYGNFYISKYNYLKALPSAAKAFRLDSMNIEVRELYAHVLNNRPERTIEDVVSAQRHFAYILKKQPKNTKILVSMATTYSLMQDFEESFKYINEALRIDPRYRDGYVLKGSNYLQMGKVDLAKSSYETAVQQDPNFYEAYIALGNLYQKEENPICIEYFTTAASIKPNDLDVLYFEAYALQDFQRFDEALVKYRKMYKKDGNFVMPLFQQGYIKQFYQNDIDSAIIFYNQALVKEPTFVQAWHNLGICYEDKKDRLNALQAYSKALKYDPNFTKSSEAAARLQ